MARTPSPRTISPRVVATGFTTAFLGDERTLREFVVGDHVVHEMRAGGDNAVLHLFNDSLDPLNPRQLRVGVDKDPRLIRQFEPFCGRPICDIPDPFDCHESYSDHFRHHLVERLGRLDIHPIVIDIHRAYQLGHYAPFLATTFEHYREIQVRIATECENYTLRNLVRIQCPQCSRIDATEIGEVAGDTVGYRCAHCGLETRQKWATVRGKLSWKLDCAARWNLYRIDTEVFSKAHLADKGTLSVSSLVSRHFYGNHSPAIVKYGDLRMAPRLSGRLIEILPPVMLKHLLNERRMSDLTLTVDSVSHFADSFEVRPGLSYGAFCRSELPRAALQTAFARQPAWARTTGNPRGLSEDVLVEHGNRFSEFYYQKRHELRWPEPRTFENASPATVQIACDVLEFALRLRREGDTDRDQLKHQLKLHLESIPGAPDVYPFLRKTFRQSNGASITTLLAILPTEYLDAIHLILSCLTGRIQSQGGSDDAFDDEQRRAA